MTLAACWQVGKLLNTPWVKFVAQATSYLFFLCVILAHGHVEQGKLCLSRVEDVAPMYRYYRQVRANLSASLQQIDAMCIRNHKPAAMELVIVLWITGRRRIQATVFFPKILAIRQRNDRYSNNQLYSSKKNLIAAKTKKKIQKRKRHTVMSARNFFARSTPRSRTTRLNTRPGSPSRPGKADWVGFG